MANLRRFARELTDGIVKHSLSVLSASSYMLSSSEDSMLDNRGSTAQDRGGSLR